MITLSIERFLDDGNKTIGRAKLINDETTEFLMECFTLEPQGPDTTISMQNLRIPKGKYSTRIYFSNKYRSNVILLSNDKVSEDRRILIHYGNYRNDTTGCILVGKEYRDNMITNSRVTFNKLLNLIKGRELKVIISNGNLDD